MCVKVGGGDTGPCKKPAIMKITGRFGVFHTYFREAGKVVRIAQGYLSHLLSSNPPWGLSDKMGQQLTLVTLSQCSDGTVSS